MGEKLLKFYKNRIKKEHKIAFFTTCALVFLIHIYLFINNIPSEDVVYNYYHNQDMTFLGRWALSFFCSFNSYFHIPWLCGLFATVYIALTVTVLVELFKVKNVIVIGLVSGFLVSANFVSDTLRYIYTADGYMMAMLLSSLAVYLTRIGEKRVSRYAVGSILICLSCGLYQAYVPFAMILVVFETLQIVLDKRNTQKECFNWLIKEIIMFVIALIGYFIIFKCCLYFGNISASSYLGISNVGKINSDMIIRGFQQVSLILKNFFFGSIDMVFATPFVILNFLFLIFTFLIIVYVFFKNKVYKKKWSLFLFVICLLSIAPLSCFWVFVSEGLDSWNYWPRMLGGLTLIYVFILILYENYCGKILKNLFFFLAVAIIFNNSVMVNISYSCMEKTYLSSYADALEMNFRIRDIVDEYETNNPNNKITEIVFLGDKVFEVSYEPYDYDINKVTKYVNSYPYLYNLKESIVWRGENAYLFFSSNFDVKYFQSFDMEYRNSYYEKEEVKNMGIWPSKNSIAIVDNVIVVKLWNEKEGEVYQSI